MSHQTLSPACEREHARSVIMHAIARSAALGDARDYQSEPSVPNPPASAGEGPWLDNRDDEFEQVVRGLTSASGPHFWLVIAPPRLGKTWFLKRLSDGLRAIQPTAWVSTHVDLRRLPVGAPYETERLAALLFGLSVSAAERPTPHGIAQQILENRRSHLGLLDSAELLDENSTIQLRSCLSRIHDLVQEAAPAPIRLGVVVASRSDSGWRGLTPKPRLSLLPLGTFGPEAVYKALIVLAEKTGRTFDVATCQDFAVRAYRATDGLPALLSACLEWIRRQQWQGMERLEEADFFEFLAGPYIDDALLADDSLFPSARPGSSGTRQVLKQALRLLVPYRLFTQSHVRHLFDSDHAFAATAEVAGWSTDDLWRALSGIALLRRPLDEPWQEIHPAIRRVLYRFDYKTHEQRAGAQREAQGFTQVWATRQSGRERVIGMTESLWHEARFLRLTRPADMAPLLSESARRLSQALGTSDAWTANELRAYAVNRMKQDDEFQDAIGGIAGLVDDLAELIITPA